MATSANRLSRFKGCLVGSVIGDCLGAPFEGDSFVSKSMLNNYLKEKLQPPPEAGNKLVQVLPYTDDTAMTRSVAQTLIANRDLKIDDLAKRFTETYYDPTEPKGGRGYGANVGFIFRELKMSNYEDVLEPGRRQFEGLGSYGNGAAMRVAPVALFYHGDKNLLQKKAKEQSLVTHTNPEGYKGAILQCLAIRLALEANQEKKIIPTEFLDSLIKDMNTIDAVAKVEQTEGEKELFKKERRYFEKLEAIKIALKEKDLNPEEAAYLLGNGVCAYESVPTAVYAFLRGLDPIEHFQSDLPFVRTLYLSISMGGDTDTIATMACAISGAHQGLEGIPTAFLPRCEGIQYAQEQAEALETKLN